MWRMFMAYDDLKIEVFTNFLYPGMVLKGDGYAEDGTMVIHKDMALTKELIGQLINDGIKKITYVRPRLKLKKNVSSSMISEKKIEKAIAVMDDVEKAIRSKSDKIPAAEIKLVVDGFVEDIRRNADACLNLLDLESFDDYTYTHSLNVSTLSIMLGLTLGLESDNIRALGITGLLHDIGKTLIPHEIIDKATKLTPAEWKIIQNHPVYGYNLLKAEGGLFNTQILNGVLLHHENFHGGGYPFGVNSDKINNFAEIISVVDVFDAITSKRSYKESKSYSEAFTYIMEESGIKFEPKIAQVFLRDLVKKINGEALYPIDSYVLLNTGEIAYIVDYRQSKYTLRPIISIFFNPQKKDRFLRFHQQIDLEQVYNRSIIKKIVDSAYINKFNKVLGKEVATEEGQI